MAIHNPVTSYGVNSSGDSEAQLVVDGVAHVARPIEGVGVMEVFDSVAALDADVPTVLTLINGTNIRMVTIGILDAVTSEVATTKSDAEVLYVAFAGTPFNDTQVAGARRVIGLGETRTFVFDSDMPATGISYAPHADSAINLQHVVVEVMYA